MADNTFDFLGEQNTTPSEVSSSTPPVGNFEKLMESFAVPVSEPSQQRMSLSERLNKPDVDVKMTYVPDSSVEPFRYQEGFEGSLFNPLDTTNQQKYANKETFGSALSKGFDSFGYKFGNTFVDYWKGYGRMADALVSMDWDKMRPDETTLAEQYYKDQIEMKKNFVFEQPEDEDSIFSKRTMSEFIGNAGFALGTFAGIGIEIAADIAITAATGGSGAVTFGATAGRLAAKEGAEAAVKSAVKTGANFADTLADIGKGFSYGNRSADELSAASKIIKQMDTAAAVANPTRESARSIISNTFGVFSGSLFNLKNSKNAGEFATNLMKNTPLLGTGIRHAEKLAIASSAGATTGQLIGIGAQGIRRVAQELNMASTEAGFEAVSTYGDTLDKITQQYMTDNDGAIPTATEYEEMRKLAVKASSSNYNTNLGLLLATNKLQFGNLFNRFLPASKLTANVIDDVLLVEGKLGTKQYIKGKLGTYGLLPQIAKDLGRKQAGFQFAKAFGKDFLTFEFSEGLQENLQEMSGSAWKNYYAGKFNGTQMALGEAFGEGFSEQFSKQGLKTFLMGALTGSVIRIPTAIATKSLDAANRAVVDRQYKSDPQSNPVKKAEEQLKSDVAVFNNATEFTNTIKRGDKSTMSSKLFNFAEQMDAAQEQTSAAQQGLKYEFENGKDNALLAAVASAQRTNSIDALYRSIKEMGVDMNAEEFEKSFGIKLADTKYSTPQEFSETVARDVKRYADTMEGLRTKLKNILVDPTIYNPDSREFFIAASTRSAQEEAIEFIGMNAAKGEMTAERAKKVADEILSVSALGASSSFAVKTLTDADIAFSEIGNARGDLRVLKGSLEAGDLDAETTKQLKEQISSKEEEIKLLEKWYGFFEDRESLLQEAIEKTTGEKPQETKKQKGKIQYAFKGKSVKKTYYVKKVPSTVTDKKGNLVDDGSQIIFDPKDEEVIDTFRKILNLKNKQAGIKTEISEQNIREVFDKVYDYMRLNSDTRDYMESVDRLMNPESLRYTVGRIADGKFKYNLISQLDPLMGKLIKHADSIINELNIVNNQDREDIYEQFAKIFDSETFKNLAIFAADPSTGIQNQDYAIKLVENLDKEILKISTNIFTKYTKGAIELTQEDYDKIIETGTINDMQAILIASKLSAKQTLTEIEEKVYKIHKETIDNELSPVTEDQNPSTAEVTPVSETITEEQIPLIGPDGEVVVEAPTGILSVKELALAQYQAEYDSKEQSASLEFLELLDNKIQELTAEIERDKSFQTTTPVETVVTPSENIDEESIEEEVEEQITPFVVTGNPQEGFDVVDRSKIPVNSDKFESEQEAEKQVVSLNSTSEDLEFVRELLKSDIDISNIEKYDEMFEKARASLKTNNSRSTEKSNTLREYYKTAKGKRLLDAIKESVITGQPVKYRAKKASPVTPTNVTQPVLFETPSSGKSATLTLSSLQKLNAKIKEIREQGLKDPNKMSKFVEKGNLAGAVVTETSILSKLQEISSCFS